MTDNSGPAFPPCEPQLFKVKPDGTSEPISQGLTKREYIAVEMAKALVANPPAWIRASNASQHEWRKGISELAYLMADTMLEGE